jgi:hypothetical protein
MKKSSEKNFGILFFIVFLAIAFWPTLNGNDTRLWSLLVSFIFLALSFLKPQLLSPLNLAWIKFGELLGRIIAPIVMALIFFFILTPLSLIIRLFLKLKISQKDTYWIKRDTNINSMDKQF